MERVNTGKRAIPLPITTTQENSATDNRSLFDTKLPSAIKVTDDNVSEVIRIVASKIEEGWRWVTAGFINDKITSYTVKAQKNQPVRDDFKNADIVLMTERYLDSKNEEYRKTFYYIDNENDIGKSSCPAEWDANALENDFNSDAEDFKLRFNPVLAAREMHDFMVDDWIVMQGKTLRVVKASDQKTIKTLTSQTNVSSEGDVEGVLLAKDFFKNNYVRSAGAYLRHLERLSCLQEAFERFFKKEIIREAVEIKLAATHGKKPRSCGEYNSYHKVTLNTKPITADDARLIKKALGVEIDPPHINGKSTIEDVVSFSKILKILTFYNKKYNAPAHVPLLVCINTSAVHVRGRGSVKSGIEVQFLLSSDTGNDRNQLVISRQKEKQSTQVKVEGKIIEKQKTIYMGNSYTYWLSSDYGSKYPPDAQTADFVLNQPLSKSKEANKLDMSKEQCGKTRNLIEFLACTQIVEAHATESALGDSRVPGMDKLARAIIKHAKEQQKPLANYFHHDKIKTAAVFYPMADKGGTSNGRTAVDKLVRKDRKLVEEKKDGGTTVTLLANNAPDFDMSSDSEVEY